jgi:hypothetical protein
LEARTDRVPKSLDFFDSTDQLVAPLKYETAAPQAAFASNIEGGKRSPAASPRQQIVFENLPLTAEGRSKPVKFVEIFGEQDAITAP